MISEQNCEREIIRFSLYPIHAPDEFDFLPEEYSKFKYGADNIARKFGYMLADGFIRNCFSKHYDGSRIVVVPSAYSHIPTASFFMKKYFVDKLNVYLFDNKYPVVEETKIHRTVTYREDYGEMSAQDRYRLIKGDKFYIDREFIENKTLLFLDDIKITGTHERIIINMLKTGNITNKCYMLYFAELADSSIPPNIENRLNNFYVKDLEQIDNIVKNERFRFNTRVVKFILNSRDDGFDRFIEKQNYDFISELYFNAIGNEYFKFPSYLRNLEKLRDITGLLQGCKINDFPFL
ncbi:MAG: phosphoribosyltransferase family protein [Prevotellaceae bacterium]|jgi:predicted amidophosphoribosyltransferase|nr:phosphoribosyltransferase family protein [Prevotellaceae bacterium]